MRLIRWYEQYIDWYYRKFPLKLTEECLRWRFPQRKTIHHMFISVSGVRLLAMVALDVVGQPIVVCHHRRQVGKLKIDGFYHAGRKYPARFFKLYLRTGLCGYPPSLRNTSSTHDS